MQGWGRVKQRTYMYNRVHRQQCGKPGEGGSGAEGQWRKGHLGTSNNTDTFKKQQRAATRAWCSGAFGVTAPAPQAQRAQLTVVCVKRVWLLAVNVLDDSHGSVVVS